MFNSVQLNFTGINILRSTNLQVPVIPREFVIIGFGLHEGEKVPESNYFSVRSA